MAKHGLHSSSDSARAGYVAPRLHMRDMLVGRALPTGRLAALGATPGFNTSCEFPAADVLCYNPPPVISMMRSTRALSRVDRVGRSELGRGLQHFSALVSTEMIRPAPAI